MTRRIEMVEGGMVLSENNAGSVIMGPGLVDSLISDKALR